MTQKPLISVAAVPYFWSKEKYRRFYSNLAETNVDIVYLGETVCSKRRSMKLEDWIELGIMLTERGKQVVLSTLTLLEAESELKYLTRISKQNNFLVEANDLASVQVASNANNPFVVGSAINIYNARSLSLFSRLGMKRWNVPVELGKDDILPLIDCAKSSNIEIEYQVFGRMPLAYSARCFTARHHELPKDNCQFKCLDDEQGILIKTQEGDSFAQINGIQTQSAKVSNLIPRWQSLVESGVNILRIVPIAEDDTLLTLNALSEMVANSSAEFKTELLNGKYEFCNGYWLQIEGMKYVA